MDYNMTQLLAISIKKARAWLLILTVPLLFTCSGDLLQGVEDIPVTEETVSISVSSLSVSTTDSTATITWTTNVETTDQVLYGTSAGLLSAQTEVTTTPTTTHSVTLTSLAVDTVYYYQVRNIHTEYGETTTTEDTFNTAYPAIIVSGASSAVTTTSATITWTTNLETTHAVIYGTTSGSLTSSTVPSTTAATTHSVTLSGLSSGTTYYYEIINYHSRYADATSSESSFATTSETAPTLAQKLRGIWVVGGTATVAGSTMLAQIDLYDPVTDTWYADVANGASGSYVPTAFGMVASVSGKLYAIGGAMTNASTVSSVFEYTIETNTWRNMTSIPYNCMAAAVYVQGSKIYIIGGTTSTVTSTTVTNNHYVFDPAGGGGSGSWSALTAYATATTGRSSMAAANFDGIVSYCGGRYYNTGAAQTTNDIYVVNANTYTSGTEQALAGGRGGMAYASYSGDNGTYFFLIGGASAVAPATSYFSLTGVTFVTQATSFYVYTPPATSAGWFTGAYHPAFTGGITIGITFAAAAVSLYNASTATDPTLYVFGGLQDSPPATISSAVYATSANGTTSGTTYVHGSWAAKSAMPRSRYGHGVTVINQ